MWTHLNDICVSVWKSFSVLHTSKFACFDLDWTCIRPIKSIHPVNCDDVTLLPNRLIVLTKYYLDGWNLVFFSNQMGKMSFINKLNRINKFIDILNLPVTVLISYQDNMYRKPNSGLFNLFKYMVEKIDDIFYCGDAAGRLNQDYSDSDLKFALNCNIKFYYLPDLFPINQLTVTSPKTCVVLMGPPGIGKTTYYHTFLHPLGFIHVKSNFSKLQSIVSDFMTQSKLICIDATNPNHASRNRWYQLCQTYHYDVITVWLLGDSKYRNIGRSNKVPEIAIHTYWKKLEPPIDGTIIEIY